MSDEWRGIKGCWGFSKFYRKYVDDDDDCHYLVQSQLFVQCLRNLQKEGFLLEVCASKVILVSTKATLSVLKLKLESYAYLCFFVLFVCFFF